MFPFLGPFIFKPSPRGVLLEIFCGGVPVSSPNPDPFSDQKVTFSHPFLDLAAKIHTRFTGL